MVQILHHITEHANSKFLRHGLSVWEVRFHLASFFVYSRHNRFHLASFFVYSRHIPFSNLVCLRLISPLSSALMKCMVLLGGVVFHFFYSLGSLSLISPLSSSLVGCLAVSTEIILRMCCRCRILSETLQDKIFFLSCSIWSFSIKQVYLLSTSVTLPSFCRDRTLPSVNISRGLICPIRSVTALLSLCVLFCFRIFPCIFLSVSACFLTSDFLFSCNFWCFPFFVSCSRLRSSLFLLLCCALSWESLRVVKGWIFLRGTLEYPAVNGDGCGFGTLWS